VTYNGHPLYYFAGDHAAGDDNGQCFDENPGTWYMLKASGAANKKQNGVTCSTTTPTNTTSGPPPVQCTPHPGDGIVSTATKGSNGEVLVDSKGCTLYLFRLDTTTASQCHGTAIHTCGYDWPPMLTSGGTSAQGNAQSGLLGTASRTDPAGTQVTYNGHPLYYYYTDNTPTTANGQNHNIYGGYWYVVTAAGDPHCPGTCH
jgi:predicted lipoprotein with Yx(FWY)xxD motif